MEAKRTCKNCGFENIGNYCPRCGQKVYTKRFTLKSFFHAILEVFNIEKGFFYTFKMMFAQPGVVINEYVSGRTKRYYNPLKYIILAAAIYAFLILYLKIFDASVETANELIIGDRIKNDQEVLELQKKWIEFYKQFVNFIPLLMIPFSSLVSKWVYASKKWYYGEHLILNCYMFAQGFYIAILLVPLVILFPQLGAIFGYKAFAVEIIYMAYALYKTFGNSVVKSFFKSLLIYLLGFFFFIFSMLLILSIAIFVTALLGFDISELI